MPQIIDACTDQFLTTLPDTLRLIVLHGVDDSYVRKFRAQMAKLHPNGFHQINTVAYENKEFVWVHLTHPSKGNGTIGAWLNKDESDTSGRKRVLAARVIRERGFSRCANENRG